ncbi:MAG: hypothetical protein ACI87E_005233, partial [Mariniblastus sp.]
FVANGFQTWVNGINHVRTSNLESVNQETDSVF